MFQWSCDRWGRGGGGRRVGWEGGKGGKGEGRGDHSPWLVKSAQVGSSALGPLGLPALGLSGPSTSLKKFQSSALPDLGLMPHLSGPGDPTRPDPLETNVLPQMKFLIRNN